MYCIYIHLILFYRYADGVTVNDEVLVNENGKLIPAKVTEIKDIIMKGYDFLVSMVLLLGKFTIKGSE